MTDTPDHIDVMEAAFKEAWHKADAEGLQGQRVRRGLVAALQAGGQRIVAEVDDTRHLIQFTDDNWTIAHPIGERLDLDSLFDCRMHWNGDDPGVRGRFFLNDDGTLGEKIRHD